METSGANHIVVSSESHQSLNDIQDYLANFNKEIQEGGQGATVQFTNSNDQNLVNQVLLQAQAAGDLGAEGVSIVQQDDNTGALIIAGGDGQSHDQGQIIIRSGQGDVQHQVAVPVSDAYNQRQLVIHDQVQGQYRLAGDQETIVMSSQDEDGQMDNSVVQVLQSVGADDTAGHVDNHQLMDLQDAQLVAVQNSQDSSQPQYVAVQGNREEQGNLEILATASQANAEGQQVMLQNAGGGGQYQTVTIVPSGDVNQSGEVSYVLIVSQPDEKKPEPEDVDMSVYDFKEEPRDHSSQPVQHISDGLGNIIEQEQPKRVIKLLPKRPAPGTTQLMCNYCNYTSPKKYLLTRHMKTHSEERPHKCNICDRGFKTIASLTNHVNTHTGTKPHKCKECPSAFTTSGELVRHVRYRHTHEKPHKCTECDYCSVELSKLKRHMRSHTGERPYQCPHCSYASPDTYKLKRHLRIHTGEKPYECDICHARFTQSNSLKAHRLIHSGTKPVYQCELCPTTCGRKTDLKIHIQKLHTSDKPLLCQKCGKSFPDRHTHKVHKRTHEGEKCFKCELCPYAALCERHLQSHLLTHTGEKPFQCDECDQSFRQKQLLKRHKNLYHTPDYIPPVPKDKSHECSECNKVFAHKGNLLRHMALHDPESPMYQQVVGPEEGEILSRNVRIPKQEVPGQMPNDNAGQPGKTVMIEVTQEGSSQQMFLLMEVPEGTNEVTPEQLAQAQEAAARQAQAEESHHQQLLDESMEDEMNGSSMSDGTHQLQMVSPNVSGIDMLPQKQEEPEELDQHNLVMQDQDDIPQVELTPMQPVIPVTDADFVQQHMHVPEPELIPVQPLVPDDESGLMDPQDQVMPEQEEDPVMVISSPVAPKRGRGRPRKDSNRQVLDDNMLGEPVAGNSLSLETQELTPSRRTPRRGKKEVKLEPDDETQRERSQQIKKDIEECFGFDVDD